MDEKQELVLARDVYQLLIYLNCITPVLCYLYYLYCVTCTTLQHEVLERDLQQVMDEKQELVSERDVYRVKYDRLNKELHYILKGDERRVLDVDALIMENRFAFIAVLFIFVSFSHWFMLCFSFCFHLLCTQTYLGFWFLLHIFLWKELPRILLFGNGFKCKLMMYLFKYTVAQRIETLVFGWPC